jgi:hypothetical protein
MTKEIDTDLFVRLMKLSAPARKDLLEYIGQGPMASDPMWAALSRHCDGQPRPSPQDKLE